MIAKKRIGDSICVRGESNFPHNIADVFRLLMNVEAKKETDPQIDVFERIEKYSSNTWIDYLKYKPVSVRMSYA